MARKTKHNLSRSRIYNIWKRMRQRCNSETHPDYSNYGGAGIKVCPEWDNLNDGFMNFYSWSMQHGYSEELFESGRGKYSLDRIDGTKGYSPENCRWATATEQALNRKTNHWVTINNITKSIEQWIEEIDISRSFVYSRIRNSMSAEEAIQEAIDYKKSDRDRGHIKKVYCIELDLEFDNTTSAMNQLNISRTSISKCCRGLAHTAGGYHWKYVD